MINKDILQRFIFENRPVRGEIVQLTDSYQTILNNQSYPPIIKKLLGETLAVTVLLTAIVKFNGQLTVQFRGNGPLKMLMAQCDNDFHIRGLAQWDEGITDESLSDSFNKGVLLIIMDPIDSGKRYQGIVSWEGDSIARSIEHYFQKSEQLNTRIWLAVNDDSASGLLLQALPGASAHIPDHEFKKSNDDLSWEHLVILTETIKSAELLNLDTLTLLRRLYVEEDVRVFEHVPVMFRCTCSLQKSENALLFIGQKEAEDELNQKDNIVVKCEFCGHEYIFDRVDVANIFKGGEQSSQQIH